MERGCFAYILNPKMADRLMQVNALDDMKWVKRTVNSFSNFQLKEPNLKSIFC